MKSGPGYYIQKKRADSRRERAQYQASLSLTGKAAPADAAGVTLLRLDAIGDFLLWLGSAPAYREVFPGEQLTLVCGAAVSPIARATGLFHRVIPLSMGRFRDEPTYQAETLELLNTLACRTLVQTVYSRTYPMDQIAAAIPAGMRISIDGEAGNESPRIKANTDRLYGRLVKTPADPFLMELKRNAAFVSILLGRSYPAKTANLPVLTQTAPIPGKPYIAVFAGANSRLRQWPEERFAALLEPLMEQTGYGCALLGIGEEGPAARRIAQLLDKGDRVQDLTGKTSLIETVELVRNARLTVGNDSSGVHMAAAVGCPALCIAGQWEYGRFLPYDVDETWPVNPLPVAAGCGTLPCQRCGALHNCYRHPACALSVLTAGKARCIRLITVQDALGAAEKIEG